MANIWSGQQQIVTMLTGIVGAITKVHKKAIKLFGNFNIFSAPYSSKHDSNGLQVDRNRKSSPRIFQLLQCSRQHPNFSAHRAALMTKTDLTYPTFFLRFVDFADQSIYPAFAVSCHSTRSDARVKFDTTVS